MLRETVRFQPTFAKSERRRRWAGAWNRAYSVVRIRLAEGSVKYYNVFMQLSLRQIQFAEQYVIDRNGRQAAMRAGYSENGADVQAVRLLRNDKIRAVVDQKCREAAARVEIQFDDVIRGLLSAFQEAQALGQPMAMISSMKEVAKLLNFYDRPAQQEAIPEGGQEYLRWLETRSDAELLAIIGDEEEIPMLVDGSDAA